MRPTAAARLLRILCPKMTARRVLCFVLAAGLVLILLILNRYTGTTSGLTTVFILANYRTGSSFTASVLASYPGAFYVFEPLKYFKNKYKQKSPQLDSRSKTSKIDEILEDLRQEDLHAWATCNLQKLPLAQFLQSNHRSMNDSLGSYVQCQSASRGSQYDWPSVFCIEQLEKACRKAPIRVIKFIRLRITSIEGIMKQYPHVKFIHLLRDPRGIAISRTREKPKDMIQSAKGYCDTIRNETSEKSRIVSGIPGRIYTLQYEHLTEYPLKYASEMLTFVNKELQLTSTMEAFIRRIALSGNETKCSYCVNRGNGTKMAAKWRLEIPWDTVRQINEVCGDILDLMGHRRFESEKQLKDMTIPYSVNPLKLANTP